MSFGDILTLYMVDTVTEMISSMVSSEVSGWRGVRILDRTCEMQAAILVASRRLAGGEIFWVVADSLDLLFISASL